MARRQFSPAGRFRPAGRSASVKALPQDTAVPHRQNLLVILHDILGVMSITDITQYTPILCPLIGAMLTSIAAFVAAD